MFQPTAFQLFWQHIFAASTCLLCGLSRNNFSDTVCRNYAGASTAKSLRGPHADFGMADRSLLALRKIETTV